MKACTPSSAGLVHHVAGHGLAGVVDRPARDAHLELPVEQPLPAAMAARGLATMAATRRLDLGIQLQLGHRHAVDQALGARLVGADEVAGDQHLEGRLARQVAAERHAGRAAEQAQVDAADGKARVASPPPPGRTSPPAGSRPRWRCPAPGDHRHRQALDASIMRPHWANRRW
jgi:hypothetical protein